MQKGWYYIFSISSTDNLVATEIWSNGIPRILIR